MNYQPLIVANWKMQLTVRESVVVAQGVASQAKKVAADLILCPSFPALTSVAEALKKSGVGLGAQDVYFETKGAFTGAVSPTMLRALGCQYVIVGHSERRRYFRETDGDVQKKVDAAIGNGLVPILCVGETRGERKRGMSERVVQQQLTVALKNGKQMRRALAIAYEPVWAISTNVGRPADPALIEEMHYMIQKIVRRLLPQKLARQTPILYGGSVDSSNAGLYVGPQKMNGALVGGASLKVRSFMSIARAVRAVSKR